MESLWEQTSGHTGFCHLEQDAKTDVLIIGGGIAGVLCAYLGLFLYSLFPYLLDFNFQQIYEGYVHVG